MASVALVVAACGGGEGGPTTPATPTEPAAPAAPVTVPTVELTLQAEDGVELVATLFGEGPVGVVLAHQRGADRTAWADVAQELAAEGFAVLTFDFRGHGESEGGELGDIVRDVRAALRTLREQGVGRVFVVGASMGGTAALALAATEELAGVVAISAPAEFQGIDAEAALSQLEAQEPLRFIMLIVAEDDQPYASDAARLAEATGARLVTFLGKEHGNRLVAQHRAEILALLREFFGGGLGRSDARAATPCGAIPRALSDTALRSR